MTEKEMIQTIYQDMKAMKAEIRELQMTLENVTNRNIKIIAEGHIDLSRKLGETL